MSGPGVSVERLMRELGHDISDERRARLLARGGAADYRDPGVFADVEAIFRRVLDGRDHDALLLPELLDVADDYTLQMRLRYASHRPLIGPLLIFIKRRLLLPINRWLYEYSLENFRRQQRVNRLLFACVEELAIENARLERRLAQLNAGAERGDGAPRSASGG
jgi:hypothetical protein